MDLPDLFREWMPHGQCVQWTPALLVPQILGDGLTALAYALIPLALVAHVRRNWRALWATQGRRMVGVYLWFAAFIVLCGGGHALNILTVWVGVYQLTAIWSLATGIVSLITVDRLWRSQAESSALWATPAGRDALGRFAAALDALTAHLAARDEPGHG